MRLAHFCRAALVGLLSSLLSHTAHAQAVSGTIAAGSEPIAVAVNPANNKVYVANWSSGNVTVIDGATGSKVDVATGTRPTWVAVNPETGYAYVGNATTGTTTVIDGTTNAVVKQINVVVPGPFAINVHGDRIYQNREGTADETNIIALSTNSYIHTAAILSYAPSALVFDPVANRLHVSTLASSDVVNMDMTGDPEYATTRYCPDGNGGLRPIDPNDHNPPTCSDVPGAPVHIAVNPRTGRVYSISNTGEISVIQKPTYSFTVLNPPGGPFTGAAAIAVNPITNKIYAAYANAIVVVDGATNAMTVLPGGGVAIGINVITNKIYVPGGNGVLTVIDGDSNAVTTLAIPSGAKGIAVNPLTNKAYVVADQVTVIDGSISDAAHAVPLTATITPLPANAGGPSGSIQVQAASGMAEAPLNAVRGIYYQLGGATSGAWTRMPGSGPFTISWSGLAAGTYTLRVVAANGLEAPNINTDLASVPIVGNVASYTFTVAPPQAGNVSVTSSGDTAYGSNATFSATVSGSAGPGTGTVAFKTGAFTIAGCEAVALASGTATCSTSKLAVGSHTITAVYSGSGNYAAATATLVHRVSGAAGVAKRSRQDFDNNGSADIMWQHTDGRVALWTMSGGAQIGGGVLFGPGTGWLPSHVGDLNADSKADIVWKHTDGSSAVWLMNGAQQTAGARLLGAGLGWSVKLVADLDGDGDADIVWQHTDGRIAAWTMQGTTQVGGAYLAVAGSGWTPRFAADFNGDGRADIVLTHTDGRVAIWLMNGTAQVGGGEILAAGTGWAPKFVADFNGDGRPDIAWQHPDGSAAIWLMNGTSMAGGGKFLDAGSGATLVLAGDINGDGKADLVLRQSDGSTLAWLMDGATKVAAATVSSGGAFTAVRVADIHGDGRGEIIANAADGRATVFRMDGASVTSADLIPPATGWSVTPLQD